ncbi:MAG: hypothetical protein ACFCU8_12030 [Thermosynechococcaceae cyanobacterium]
MITLQTPQAAIEEVLSLTSVISVVLLQNTELPYFYGTNNHLDQQQQYMVAYFINNIVETMPESMKAFDFPVIDFYAYAYLLTPEITFVILAQRRDLSIKLLATRKIQAVINEYPDQVIDFFARKHQKDKPESVTVASPDALAVAEAGSAGFESIERLGQDLNNLSQIVCKYLGPKLTQKYWNEARPQFAWIENFQINNQAEITFSGDSQAATLAEHYHCITEWTAAFLQPCSQIIQDLPQKIEQHHVGLRQKQYLSICSQASLSQSSHLDSTEDSLF